MSVEGDSSRESCKTEGLNTPLAAPGVQCAYTAAKTSHPKYPLKWSSNPKNPDTMSTNRSLTKLSPSPRYIGGGYKTHLMWDDVSLVLQRYLLQHYLKAEDSESVEFRSPDSDQMSLVDGVLSVLDRVRYCCAICSVIPWCYTMPQLCS